MFVSEGRLANQKVWRAKSQRIVQFPLLVADTGFSSWSAVASEYFAQLYFCTHVVLRWENQTQDK